MTSMPGQRRRAALPEGLTPRFLSVDEAAAYVGVSRDLFLTEVEHGYWPPARRRGFDQVREGGKDGRRLTWDRKALDAAADAASGLSAATPTAAEDARKAAERMALNGVANGPTPKQRNQGRPAQAA